MFFRFIRRPRWAPAVWPQSGVVFEIESRQMTRAGFWAKSFNSIIGEHDQLHDQWQCSLLNGRFEWRHWRRFSRRILQLGFGKIDGWLEAKSLNKKNLSSTPLWDYEVKLIFFTKKLPQSVVILDFFCPSTYFDFASNRVISISSLKPKTQSCWSDLHTNWSSSTTFAQTFIILKRHLQVQVTPESHKWPAKLPTLGWVFCNRKISSTLISPCATSSLQLINFHLNRISSKAIKRCWQSGLWCERHFA